MACAVHGFPSVCSWKMSRDEFGPDPSYSVQHELPLRLCTGRTRSRFLVLDPQLGCDRSTPGSWSSLTTDQSVIILGSDPSNGSVHIPVMCHTEDGGYIVPIKGLCYILFVRHARRLVV